MKRLGSRGGAEEIKGHPYFDEVDWSDIMLKRIKPPEPYLAEYAKNIIQISPYMAAGHPKTRGKMCARDHPQYVQGWSFADHSRKSTEQNNY